MNEPSRQSYLSPQDSQVPLGTGRQTNKFTFIVALTHLKLKNRIDSGLGWTICDSIKSTIQKDIAVNDLTKITLAENGPLLVDNPPNLEGSEKYDLSEKQKIALCRCGASKSKPFCDGSHRKINFDSNPRRELIRNTPINYSSGVDGLAITIGYTPVLCTHAAQCQARAKEVFNPKEKPWIRPENGSIEAILGVIAACPSGALRVSIGNQSPQHMTSIDVRISIQKNGPYHVSNVQLDAEFNGAGASHSKYSLCRCGLSNNKPFCDGSHYNANWTDNNEKTID